MLSAYHPTKKNQMSYFPSHVKGLQSCLEPSQMAKPLVLSLKIGNVISSEEAETKPLVGGGWSFLQSFASATYIQSSQKRQNSYVSDEAPSLEMCTESLGSETGTYLGDDDLPSLFSTNTNVDNIPALKASTRKYKRSVSFPPPLTSICGSSSVRVKRYREDGRLVLKAVAISSCEGFYQVERENGRTTLSLIKDRDCEDESNVEEQEVSKCEEDDAEKMTSRMSIGRCKENKKGTKEMLTWGEPFWVKLTLDLSMC